MKYAFCLIHRRRLTEDIYAQKNIGWFSTKKEAKKVKKQYKKKPGFRYEPQYFKIKKYRIDKTTKKWNPQKSV